MVELAHSKNIIKKLDLIKKELSDKSNEQSKNIYSVFQVGSTVDSIGKEPIYEDNESSDVDLIFVANTKYLLRNKENLEEYISKFKSDKIQVWLKSKAQYEEPEKYFEPGHPASDLWELDGWDSLGKRIGLNIELTSGKTLFGEKIIEKARENFLKDPTEFYIPPEEGYELDIVAIRDCLKGLSGRTINKAAEELSKDESITEVRDAFVSYPNKKNKDLTDLEKRVKDYVLTKDNDLAKSLLRGFLGVYTQATNKPITNNSKKIYSRINEEAKIIFNDQDRKVWRNLINSAYKIKVNDNYGNIKWDWDWSGKNTDKNKALVDKVAGFFTECFIYSSEMSHLAGYTWTQDFQQRMSNHLARRAPGVIDVLDKIDENEFNTLENMIDLYVGEIVETFSNRLDLPGNDKLSVISESKGSMLNLIERIAKKYDIPGEVKVLHKDRLLRLGQMQLMLAQNGKEEYYDKAKNSLEEALSQETATIFSNIIPTRISWTSDKEATALINLGECFLGCENKQKAINSINRSLDLNPRNSYSWKLLSKISNDNEERKLYSIISDTLRAPNNLLSLDLIVKDKNKLEDILFSPWRNLIKTHLKEDEKDIALEYSDILHRQKHIYDKIKLKDDNLLLLVEHFDFLDKERSNLKESIRKLRGVTENIGRFNGTDLFQLEKVITSLKKKTMFNHQRNMEINSLTNMTINNLKELEKIEKKLNKTNTKKLRKEYVDTYARVSYIDTIEKLEEWRNNKVIEIHEFNELYEEATPTFAEEVYEIGDDLVEIVKD